MGGAMAFVLSHGRNACAVRRRSCAGVEGLQHELVRAAGAALVAASATFASGSRSARSRAAAARACRISGSASKPPSRRHLEVEDDAAGMVLARASASDARRAR